MSNATIEEEDDMKSLYRILAMLLPGLMLCSVPGAVAQPQDGLDVPEAAESVELETVRDWPDVSLDLPEELALSDSQEPLEPAVDTSDMADETASTSPNADEDPFSINEEGVLIKYSGNNRAVTIPDTVVAVGRNAFKGNTRLTDVTIPAGVTTIQAKAFSGCKKLTTVNVLAREIAIASEAFSGAKPVFCTVVGSDAAAWARRKGFRVEDNLVVPGKDVRMAAAIGDTLRVFTSGRKAISFYSSNTSVATVSRDGIVSVINGGTTQITVWLEDWTPLYITLSVPFPEASLSERSLSLGVGGTRTLTVDNLSGRTVSWFSSNMGIASVRGGLVTAIRPGVCTVAARLSDGTTLSCAVTVTDNAALSRTSLSMKAGYTHRLSVSGLGGRTVHWSSGNGSIASVKDGVVTALKAGKCTIIAQVQNGRSLKCGVTVKDAAKLSRTSISLKVGGFQTLKVVDRGNRTVTWSSSNSAIATAHGGMVVARKAGSCTVTASLSGGRKLTCKVTVSEKTK